MAMKILNIQNWLSNCKKSTRLIINTTLIPKRQIQESSNSQQTELISLNMHNSIVNQLIKEYVPVTVKLQSDNFYLQKENKMLKAILISHNNIIDFENFADSYENYPTEEEMLKSLINKKITVDLEKINLAFGNHYSIHYIKFLYYLNCSQYPSVLALRQLLKNDNMPVNFFALNIAILFESTSRCIRCFSDARMKQEDIEQGLKNYSIIDASVHKSYSYIYRVRTTDRTKIINMEEPTSPQS